MAENDRVVFPDEVEDVKEKAVEKVDPAAGDSNSVEEAPQETTANSANPNISMRNMIQVPYNCPEGYKMDANGVCREIF